MELPEGAYDLLISEQVSRAIDRLPEFLQADWAPLGPEDAVDYLVRELASRFRAALRETKDSLIGKQLLRRTNELLATFADDDPVRLAQLKAVRKAVEAEGNDPIIPLAKSALVTNNEHLNYYALLRSELKSADEVDFICPFIGSQGVNLLFELLKATGVNLRVLTTTYLGGTHRQAIDRLVSCGAKVKVVYERAEQKTALHAKAWVFHRRSGFSTATIGSSNLSPKALVDGLEWNIRVSAIDSPIVFDEIKTTFERLWNDERFDEYIPERDGERLSRALQSQRDSGNKIAFLLDVHPYPHQREALDALRLNRMAGRHENLIVSATGTGKTLISAFDYQAVCEQGKRQPRLLFVAHRKDILEQSRAAFRSVLRDPTFGELHVGQHRADDWRHVFASIQSMHSEVLSRFAKDHFDYIVIDEFHHAEAPTYRKLVEHFEPKELLGLTATPERTDGNRELIERFGQFAYELRLWRALDAGLLSPFHYYGIDDGTDLSDIPFLAGRYEKAALEEKLLDRADSVFRQVLLQLDLRVDDADGVRAVVFCAGIRHAKAIAEHLIGAGLSAKALHSEFAADERDQIMSEFRRGDVSYLCTVDLLNEGVDIPEIDVVIFLRPTESAIVFAQQLGRGLRLHKDKGALTVLDFVGQQNRKFRLDLRFRAMTGLSRGELKKAIEQEFPRLPPGCHINLDKVSMERALRNLKEAVPSRRPELLAELRNLLATGEPVTVSSFLNHCGIEPVDFYDGSKSLGDLLREVEPEYGTIHPKQYRLESLIHIDDLGRCEGYLYALESQTANYYSRMAASTLLKTTDISKIQGTLRAEAIELLSFLELSCKNREAVAPDLPFALHALYSGNEIVAPFRDKVSSMRQGTFHVANLGLDVHLFTLRKSEKLFSPTTMYKDKVLSNTLIQWESQSRTTRSSPTGKRLIEGIGRHLLFVRETKEDCFFCLGFARPVSNSGEKPILMTWRLDTPVPESHLYRFMAAS